MNQISSVPFGSDANVFQAYAESANDRLGALDFVFENTGANTAYIRLAQYDGSTSPSGFATIDSSYTASPFTANFLGFAVAPGGTVTKHYVLISKRVAFFGSGNTVVNISPSLRNKGDLRGAQIDIVAVGRRGWGYDEAWNRNELIKKWGSVAGPVSTSNNINAGQGNVNPSGTTI